MTERPFPYDAFRKNPDGSISTVRAVVIEGPTGGKIRLGVGVTFGAGTLLDGMDIGDALTGEKAHDHQKQRAISRQ